MVINAAGQNFVSESNHSTTSFASTFEQVNAGYASSLEEVRVTGADENMDNETFQSNQF